EFSKAAAGRFGSGWAWLVLDGGKLKVLSTANQDSPLMDGQTPILGLDVWEHAYYLKYQNRRPEYIQAWWNVVNWEEVSRLYEQARGWAHQDGRSLDDDVVSNARGPGGAPRASRASGRGVGQGARVPPAASAGTVSSQRMASCSSTGSIQCPIG